jgi:DNA-binding transcriptional LysR family regulator
MMIDLVQLRTFVAVAEEQHLTRASERLHISQSAASAHVRAVEDCLDTQLFVRTNRSLELTKDGQLLLRQAKTLLNEASQFQSFARELHGKTKGTLVIGASSEPLASRIGDVIAALRERYPLINVDLRARPSSGTRQALKTGEIDLGMLLGRPIDAGFTYYQLSTVQFRVAGPAAWKKQISTANWGELASMPWILPTSSSIAYTLMMDQLFKSKGFEPNGVATFDNAALGRALLEAGVGLMLIREEYALQGEKSGLLSISPIAQAQFGLFISHLASRRNDPLIRAFVESVSISWPEMRPATMPNAIDSKDNQS